MPETGKLTPFRQVTRFLLILALAFGVTWLGLRLQDRVWPRPAAAVKNRQPSRAKHRAKRFAGWDRSRVQVVAEATTGGGIPVPLDASVAYRLSKQGRWGRGYQGFFESPQAPDAVARFFAQALPQAGWQTNSELSAGLTERTDGVNLAFSRGTERCLVSIYRAGSGRPGTDFRVSVLVRPAP